LCAISIDGFKHLLPAFSCQTVKTKQVTWPKTLRRRQLDEVLGYDAACVSD
jgi:hypothetical protein